MVLRVLHTLLPLSGGSESSYRSWTKVQIAGRKPSVFTTESTDNIQAAGLFAVVLAAMISVPALTPGRVVEALAPGSVVENLAL